MKKLLLFLFILSMFMVSCGPSKEEAIEKAIEEADANQEAVKENEETNLDDSIELQDEMSLVDWKFVLAMLLLLTSSTMV